MRVYLPATVVGLHRMAVDSVLEADRATGLTGFAVTPGLRAWYQQPEGLDPSPSGSANDDDEDLEYAAAAEAARASLRLLSVDEGAPRRRVVIAAELPVAEVVLRDDLDRGVVRINRPVLESEVAAVFVDDEQAESVVARAVPMIDRADLGDPEAVAVVDDAEGFELSWFDAGELPALIGELATMMSVRPPPRPDRLGAPQPAAPTD